jgi:two-component system CheB/CheR fusion protein
VEDAAGSAPEILAETCRAMSLEQSGAALSVVVQPLLKAAALCAGAQCRVALFLLDQGDGALKLVAAEGQAHGAAWDDAHAAGATRPWRSAVQLGEPVLVNDVALEPGWTPLEHEGTEFARACWSFPVIGQADTVLGSLAVCFPDPQQDDHGRIGGLTFIAQCAALTVARRAEVERRRGSEARLRQTEARYLALTQVLTVVVWTTDPDGRVIAPQGPWGEYTGQSWEQQREFGWLEAIHPDDRDHVQVEVARARQAKDRYQVAPRIWHGPSQGYRRCETSGLPIVRDGQLAEWIGTCIDVEDQRQAEEALLAADRRKDDFIAMLAHELRSPLAPIRNAVYILKGRGAGDAQLSWASKVIERQVDHMARLLEDLLDVSRITREKLELRTTRLTLDSILETALESSRPAIEQHGHHLELNILAGPIYIEADPARLAQVFSNLLINAAKYTDRGGKVNLTVKKTQREAVVTVRDNGIGIEPEMLPKVFHLYSRSIPALERSHSGLGIGLSLVRGLVELHGGTVTAHSAGPGRGSEFVVRLPLAKSRAAPAAAAAAGADQVPPMRILVADDNRDTAETLSVLLQMMGHQVRAAGDGAEAIDMAASFEPMVVLLDIGMPKVNGYEAAGRIRQLVPKALLIATTGHGQPEDVRRAAAAGFDHHLVKPVKPEQVQHLLTKLIQSGPAQP